MSTIRIEFSDGSVRHSITMLSTYTSPLDEATTVELSRAELIHEAVTRLCRSLDIQTPTWTDTPGIYIVCASCQRLHCPEGTINITRDGVICDRCR